MPPIIIGLILSVFGIGFGIGTGVLVKLLSADVNLATTLFYRFLFSLPLLFLVAIITRGRDFYKINAKKNLSDAHYLWHVRDRVLVFISAQFTARPRNLCDA